jgi:hypothetical protein
MSTTLAQVQQRFLDAMRGGDADGVLVELAPIGRISAGQGLAIYQHAYSARLIEALDSDHAMLGAYLGDALWQQLCDGYVSAQPSRYRSLRRFGEHLPEYLASNEPFAEHPEIAELAAFERRLLDGFDAADAERAAWDDMLALSPADWPGLRLRFHPSLQTWQARFNSIEIWRALKASQAPPGSVRSDSDWALWRDNERITRFRSLEHGERIALLHFLEGGDFSGLCEKLLERLDTDAVPMYAIALLQRWCEEGWVRQTSSIL